MGTPNCYSLQLANGKKWLIVGNKDTKYGLAQYAHVMELKASVLYEGLPKIIFTESDGETDSNIPISNLDASIKQYLPIEGWKIVDILKGNHFIIDSWNREGIKPLKHWFHHSTPDVIYDFGLGNKGKIAVSEIRQVLFTIYDSVLSSQGLPIHAGLIELNGKGILLAASGGTGKSTCCDRILPPWRAICDDEVVVVYDEKSKQYLVHAFPTWSKFLLKPFDKTWNVQQSFPLHAILFLKQAKVDKVISIGKGQASLLIAQSAKEVYDRNWKNLEHKEKIILWKDIFDNACKLSKAVQSYHLHVSLTGQFWKEIEKVL